MQKEGYAERAAGRRRGVQMEGLPLLVMQPSMFRTGQACPLVMLLRAQSGGGVCRWRGVQKEGRVYKGV